MIFRFLPAAVFGTVAALIWGPRELGVIGLAVLMVTVPALKRLTEMSENEVNADR